jgi:hypothetical protein
MQFGVLCDAMCVTYVMHASCHFATQLHVNDTALLAEAYYLARALQPMHCAS